MKQVAVTIILFFLYMVHANAQSLHFTNINAEMGLPSNECYRIVQDKIGYIWISTDAGLVKYNSKEFVLFNKAMGMPSINDIYALSADNQGRIWFATGRWKIGYILNDTVHVLDQLVFKRETNGDVIYKIQFLESTNTLLVCGRFNSYEVSLSNGNSTVKKIYESPDFCTFFFVRDGKKKYIATQYKSRPAINLLHCFLALGNMELLELPNIKGHYRRDCFTAPLSNGNIALNIDKQLFVLDRNNKIKWSYSFKAEIQSLCADRYDNIWVGCKDGIFLLDNKKAQQHPSQIMYDASISGIIEDAEGSMWFTSLDNGVFFCSNSAVKTITKLAGEKKPGVFCKVVNGRLWFNDVENPLTVIGSDTQRIPKIAEEKKPRVTDVVFASDRYIVTTTLGIYTIDKSLTKTRQLYFHNIPVAGFGISKKPNNQQLAFNNITFFGISKDSLIAGHILRDLRINDAIWVNNAEVLVASNMGLYGYQQKDGAEFIERTRSAHYGHDINKLFLDSKGNIWLPSTNDTLYVLDIDFNLKSAIVLPFKNITCRQVMEVSSNEFLVCSNIGLLDITFKNGHLANYDITLFDQSSGLMSSDVYAVLNFRNKLFIATSKGLCSVDNIQQLKYTSSPQTNINSFYVNNRYAALSAPRLFSYKQNNLSFQVDALSFKKVGQREAFFKYRLEGWDSDYKTATSSIVSYNNLPSGHYTFLAKTFYDDATEDESPAKFSFTIQPAFWQTWWGIGLIGFVAIGCIVLFVQWRIKKIKTIEKEKAIISQTIAEYRFTALKAQMDPHFIFNSVNVIQNLILEKDRTEAYNSLEKFSRLIRMVLNQSDSVFATVEEELALIDMYVELNQLRVDYPFTFEKDIQPAVLQCQVPSLIIQPFIENALWHGILPLKGSKKGMVCLKISIEGKNMLVIGVQDNGVGRKVAANNASVNHISKGVKLIEERLEAYRSMNNGCFAKLVITDLEENGRPTGTLVQIKIELVED
jgi:ligand-binding sensor domain-containing protein